MSTTPSIDEATSANSQSHYLLATGWQHVGLGLWQYGNNTPVVLPVAFRIAAAATLLASQHKHAINTLFVLGEVPDEGTSVNTDRIKAAIVGPSTSHVWSDAVHEHPLADAVMRLREHDTHHRDPTVGEADLCAMNTLLSSSGWESATDHIWRISNSTPQPWMSVYDAYTCEISAARTAVDFDPQRTHYYLCKE